jgi:hypothetical protein
MEHPVSIDMELIAVIIRLPSMGEKPAQYLDDKTKEKALEEEMKSTYGIERGSCSMIIKRISDVVTWMATNLMAYKMLLKCHKKEVPIGVRHSCSTV